MTYRRITSFNVGQTAKVIPRLLPLLRKWYIRAKKTTEWGIQLIDSIVIYPNSVTTLWLVCFDGGIEFQGPFLKKLATRSLPKTSVFF